MKILIIQDGQEGTEALVKAIAEGANEVDGAIVTLKSQSETDDNELAAADAIIWGSSGYICEFAKEYGRLIANTAAKVVRDGTLV